MATLELKPIFSPKRRKDEKEEKEEQELQQQREERLLTSLRLMPGLNPSKTTPQRQPRFIDGMVSFLSSLGMILAMNFSYSPDSENPLEEQEKLKSDPLAWKKKNSNPVSAAASSLSFLKIMTPRPQPGSQKRSEEEAEKLKRDEEYLLRYKNGSFGIKGPMPKGP